MPGTNVPFVKPQWFDNNGDPASGYKLFTYAAGTSTKQATYSNAALTVPNTNPIILDSAGRASVFLMPTSYGFVLALPTDTDPPTSPIWTEDGINAIPSADVAIDILGTAGEGVLINDVLSLSDGQGGLTAGRWYKADADVDYLSVFAPAIGFAVSAMSAGAQGSIRRVGRVTGFAGLVPGSIYYVSTAAGAITATPPANARAVGWADSATSLVLGTQAAQSSATMRGGANVPYPQASTAYHVFWATAPVLVQSIVAIHADGTSCTVNVRKNGSLALRSSDYTTTSSWALFGTLQNATLAPGDYLEVVIVNVSGAVSQVAIQINMLALS